MTTFRWGIFGTGAISYKFAAGLTAARDARVELVASRSPLRAQALAAAIKAPRTVAGYPEAARAGGIDAAYIATPPSEHVKQALLCIEAGIPVLVEKPFASNTADAARIADAARAHSVFAMEAMWTRFQPAAQAMRDELAAGAIGTPRFVTGSFGISHVLEPDNNMFNPALGGGALAHLGAYPISLGQWLFGTPMLIAASGRIGATEVDEDAAFQLVYPGGVIGSFLISLATWAPDEFRLLGSEGMIAVRGSIVRAHGLDIVHEAPRRAESSAITLSSRLRQHGLAHAVAQRLNRSSRERGRRVNHRYAGNGYHYEADEVRACVGRGAIESAVMPLDESISVARTTDEIRAALRCAAATETMWRAE